MKFKENQKFLTRQIVIHLVRKIAAKQSDVSTMKTADDTNCPTIHSNL